MKLVSSADLEWKSYPGQRVSTITYLGLLQGEPSAPDNYEMSLNHFGKGGSFSPRHRHNFEQFRYAFDVPLNYSPKQDVPPHQLGYFPEGAYYGPQDILEGAHMLIVQFGGASGSGYMSWDALMRGTNELKQKGEFVKGIYTYYDGEGRKHNKDGYEAVWEHVSGKSIAYPAPRYREPVVIDPEAFTWIPVDGEAGVEERYFGEFNERRAAAGQIRMAAGSRHTLATNGGPLLVFVLSGSLDIDGKNLPKHSAIEVAFGEQVAAAAPEDTLLITFRMSDFVSLPAGIAAGKGKGASAGAP